MYIYIYIQSHSTGSHFTYIYNRLLFMSIIMRMVRVREFTIYRHEAPVKSTYRPPSESRSEPPVLLYVAYVQDWKQS